MSVRRLDVVIINHAAFQEKLLMEHSSPSELVSELTRIHSANVVGPTLLSLAALSALERTSGRLVFISSGSAIATPPFHVIYAAR